jgi:uncharacterized protein YdeI (YjbR/CyaY-like superfamily)
VSPRPARDELSLFPSAAAFRAWLEQHHDDTTEVWVGYYRKGTGKTGIAYPEAVDEALCYGWIDGLTYRIDDEVHTNRFTPRRRGSTWSTTNVRRVQELINEGRMTPAGLAAFEARTTANTGIYSYENRPRELPTEYARQLQANAGAWAFWQSRTPGFRRTATWWVVNAKQEATRQRHLDQLIADLAVGVVPKPLRPFGSE